MLSASSINKILNSKNYRSFISTYKEERSKDRAFTYTQISRKAGFASRSFVRDVTVGNKKITSASLYPIIKGLGLSGDLAEYFKTLVHIEHPETCYPERSLIYLRNTATKLKDRLQKKRRILDIKSDPYRSELFPFIYAALGTVEEGASVDEIKKKTGFLKEDVLNTLASLEELGLVLKKENRYFAEAVHLFVEQAIHSKVFEKNFDYLLSLASIKAKKDFQTANALFFTSSFSVNKRKMAELKTELRDVLLKYVDVAEESTGDKVASIVCSLF